MNEDNNYPASATTPPSQDDSAPASPDETLNTQQDVPATDVNVQPSTDLQGYQEDLNSGENQKYDLQSYGDTTPADATQMPESALKTELDGMAFGETADTNDTPNDDAPNGDDMREHVEDMDEADK